MLGLIIGVLWYVFAVLVGSAGPEVTLLAIANFLWYWYLVWGCIVLCLPIGVSLFGAVLGIGGACAGEGSAAAGGAIFGLVGILLGVIVSVSTMLYLTAVWLLYHAGDAATSLAEWDMQYLIASGICAFLALAVGRMSSHTSKSSD
jgi:hypothetical protein